MANYIALQLRHPAPFACNFAQVASGGSGWAGSYSFLVVGWLTPSEDDFVNAAAFNVVANNYGSAAGSVVNFEQGIWSKGPLAAATVTISWQLPKHKFHHISVYNQSGTSFNPLAPALKMQPSGSDLIDGNVPGSATSADFISPSGMTQRLTVPILATDATANTVTIPGNRIVSFGPGTTFDILNHPDAAAGLTVISAKVDYTNDGVVTVITITSITTTGVDTGQLRYDVGPATFDWPPASLTLSPVTDAVPRRRENSSRLNSGILAPRRPRQTRYTDMIEFEVDFTAFTSATAGSLFQMLRWAAQGNYVQLSVFQDADVVERRAQSWFGHLRDLNDEGMKNIQSNDAVRFGLLVDQERTIDHDFGWFTIRAVSTGSGTFTIEGDWEREFVAGRPFRVLNSTGNDQVWAVSSSAYTAATNRTAITVTGNITDATVDGEIELYNW